MRFQHKHSIILPAASFVYCAFPLQHSTACFSSSLESIVWMGHLWFTQSLLGSRSLTDPSPFSRISAGACEPRRRGQEVLGMALVTRWEPL